MDGWMNKWISEWIYGLNDEWRDYWRHEDIDNIETDLYCSVVLEEIISDLSSILNNLICKSLQQLQTALPSNTCT